MTIAMAPNCYECKWRECASGGDRSHCTNQYALVTLRKPGTIPWQHTGLRYYDPAWVRACTGFESEEAGK